eukprot:jgi/Botrbrau1/3629/Bobra.0204s0021.2
MIDAIMPFSDTELEKEFLSIFHTRRAAVDIFSAIFSLYHGVKNVGQSAHPALWTVFCVTHSLVIFGSFKKGFLAWRLLYSLALRALGASLLFVHVRDQYAALKAPTFIGACYHAFISYSRFKLPLLSALLVQIPFRNGHILIQTFLVLFLLAQSLQECRLMPEVNSDFRRLADQLEENYLLWSRGGPTPTCQHFCWILLQQKSGLCLGVCSLVLPGVWRVYGPPWLHTCILQRLISVMAIGYVVSHGGAVPVGAQGASRVCSLQKIGRGRPPNMLSRILLRCGTRCLPELGYRGGYLFGILRFSRLFRHRFRGIAARKSRKIKALAARVLLPCR